VRTASKLLKLRPYKTIKVHTLQLHDTVIPVAGIFIQFMVSSSIPSQYFFQTSVNFTRLDTWAHKITNTEEQKNWHRTHEVPLHDLKIGVWLNMSASRILGPVFYADTINSERYVRHSATGPEIFTLQCYCSLTIGTTD
jgi:hypothetical protein